MTARLHFVSRYHYRRDRNVGEGKSRPATRPLVKEEIIIICVSSFMYLVSLRAEAHLAFTACSVRMRLYISMNLTIDWNLVLVSSVRLALTKPSSGT